MFEATLHLSQEKADVVKQQILDLVKGSGYLTLPDQGPFKDGHLEIVAVDKKKTDMLKYKLDPKAKFKKEAQRAGLEMNVFPSSKGFYLYLTIRPYMELMDAPEIPGVTADEIEQRTDEMLCSDVFKSILPKLKTKLDAEIISRQVPIASKVRKKKVKMRRAKGSYEPEFVVVGRGGDKKELAGAREEVVECKMKFEELNKEMERMRILGKKEKERCADQYFSTFILDIGEIVDNLDRALDDPTLGEEHAKGLDMIRRQFFDTLEKYNVDMIDPKKGEEFDVRKHEALSTKEDASLPSDTILQVIRKGYIYKENIIRPAQVITVR